MLEGKVSRMRRAQMQEFARRLYKARRARNWSQSDLARALWGTTVNTAGYTVAKNRDYVSTWERGVKMPGPAKLEQLCEVLGMTPTDLVPDIADEESLRPPELQITQDTGKRDEVHLQVDMFVPATVASQVYGLLAAHQGAAR